MKSNLIKGKCKYYGNVYVVDPKRHDTSSLKNHFLTCLKNPHAKKTKPSKLTFALNYENESVLTNWVFSQENENTAKMIIIDELPFRFIMKIRITLKGSLRNTYNRGMQIAKPLEIEFLKNKLVSWRCSSVKAQYLHLRCIAQILNLLVQTRMKMTFLTIKKFRDNVKGSPTRLFKFKELATLIRMQKKCSLYLE
ncbi:LOW QUALITY PROTEIN: hypothetical protein OSB04_020801 [Centaurea solstitialis]|uniref:Uncharacterized protein n=1 Tax=Centaurea solstitialis TaxID=347529 RepID=A0AA38TCK9_9ASTR|nr:LOW QUALITY PROTEIN: hypothetical protein OSB04_020801 [Centaurea solstitialis]